MANNKTRDDLFYFKWHVNDAKTLKRQVESGHMTMEQVGELFLLVMDYVAFSNSGEAYEEPDVPPSLSYAFSNFQIRVDDARNARIAVGKSRAESGRLGGQAKARKAAQDSRVSTASEFKPPTLKQFQATVAHFSESGDIEEDVDSYEVDKFFDLLKDAGWTIGGEPIQHRDDWESAIMARFYDFYDVVDSNLPKSLYYKMFEQIFADFQGLRDKDGKTHADSAACDFFYAFDKESRGWNIQGKEYPPMKWAEALAEFMKDWDDGTNAIISKPSKC